MLDNLLIVAEIEADLTRVLVERLFRVDIQLRAKLKPPMKQKGSRSIKVAGPSRNIGIVI